MITMAVNKDFAKFKWAYPHKIPATFIGAVCEYALVGGGHLSVAFNADGAFIFKDDAGYFDTVDYIAKDGLFNTDPDLALYDDVIVVGSVTISEAGNTIEDISVNEAILDEFDFRDGVYTVKNDIYERLKATGKFGFTEILKG